MCCASLTNMSLQLAASVLFLISGVLSANVVIKPKYQVVKEGDPIEVLCTIKDSLDFCLMEIPGEGKISLSEKKPSYNGITYLGKGLSEGECGASIPRALQKHNGQIRCSFTSSRENTESAANMTLIVAKAPTRPTMSVTKSLRGNHVYREGETLSASCTVMNGRPPANISWYLDNMKLHEGIEAPSTSKASDELFTVVQKLTLRSLQPQDNGKFLKCQAEHPLLQDKDSSTTQLIQVYYAPKAEEPLEQFGLVEGEDGRVEAMVLAHPRPTFTWRIDGVPVFENDHDHPRFRVETPVELPPGSGKWQSVLVIKSLMKEDVEKEYTLSVLNDVGEKQYTVSISTSPEPQGIDMSAGTIIAIVAAVLVVVTVTAMLLFARAKGRWCFAGGQSSRTAGESSDTESAEHHAESKNKLPFTSVFKKKTDKVSATEMQETVNEVAADKEKDPEESSASVAKEDKEGKDEGVVYAELDLQNSAQPRGLTVRPDNDKTEYAEIIHSKEK